MRVLITLGLLGASALFYRYAIGISNPRYDSYYLVRVIGRCERVITRIDAWLSRTKVAIIDRLEIDRLAWLKLRERYTPEMS